MLAIFFNVDDSLELILKGQIVWKAGVLFFSFLELPETRVMVASGLLKDFFFLPGH
jgi:hypothetical protein